MSGQSPILVCYDGSENAKEAIGAAAALFPGRATLVAHFWEPLGTAASVPPVPGLGGMLRKGLDEIDEAGVEASRRLAEEGARLATERGLRAEPVSERTEGRAWRSIVALARARDVGAIVLGRRGLSGIEQVVMGSVSNAVLNRADRPVLVVPADGEV